MSRTEELRAKLRAKFENFDTGFSEFNSKVDNFLEKKFSASASSSAYTKSLYEEYKKENPIDFDQWITSKLASDFQSAGKKPIWIIEPDWCFFEEKPMKFIEQFVDERDITYYVFRGVRDTDLGKRALYKMLAQDKEGKIRLSGEILG
jgi:hypothetical protein